MMKNRLVRGMHDLYGKERSLFRYIDRTSKAVMDTYGYKEIITPVIEFTELFARGMGETSDVVSKEMYTFERGDESLTLRPEGTAGVCRALISEGMGQNLPLKFSYFGPMFRYERPQKGRQRQFHQIGAEIFGVDTPQADVEIIALTMRILEKLDLSSGLKVHINTLGDTESRQSYKTALVAYLEEFKDKLSKESQERLYKNPLRILDSKDDGDKEIVKSAPKIKDYLNESSREFFANVGKGLANLGIAYVEDDKIVRGLDYYNHTVFEIIDESSKLGTQNTVAGGGRYNGLIKALGGSDICGVGMSIGVERLMLMLGTDIAEIEEPRPITVIPVSKGEEDKAIAITQELRMSDIYAEIGYSGNMTKRMKKADKMASSFAIIVGEEELAKDTVLLRNLDSGEQRTIVLAELVSEVEKEIKR